MKRMPAMEKPDMMRSVRAIIWFWPGVRVGAMSVLCLLILMLYDHNPTGYI